MVILQGVCASDKDRTSPPGQDPTLQVPGGHRMGPWGNSGETDPTTGSYKVQGGVRFPEAESRERGSLPTLLFFLHPVDPRLGTAEGLTPPAGLPRAPSHCNSEGQVHREGLWCCHLLPKSPRKAWRGWGKRRGPCGPCWGIYTGALVQCGQAAHIKLISGAQETG